MSKISEFMSTTIYSTRTDAFAHEAIDKMYKNKIGALLVETEGTVSYTHLTLPTNREV